MTGDDELLVLRLAMIAIIFLFVVGVAFMMRAGVSVRTAGPPAGARRREAVRGPRLVVLIPARTGLVPGDEFALAGEMTLGRDAANGIVLADASVSGRHAAIVRARGGWRVTDLGSTNGTLVNGRAVDGRGAALSGGEQLALGSVVMRFEA